MVSQQKTARAVLPADATEQRLLACLSAEPVHIDEIGNQVGMPISQVSGALALMELKGGKYRFKAKAYNAGARSLQAVANLDQLIKEDRLTSLPRIGEALASQIKQLYLTGESSVLKDLKEEFPVGTAELSTVPGLSIAKVSNCKKS
jgi:hypothetical protein